MNLNNNWINTENGVWINKSDTLSISDFESIKKEMKSYRFYQKCLSGSTYVSVDSKILGNRDKSSINDIYEVLSYTSSSYYYDYIGVDPINYIVPFSGVIPQNYSVIKSKQDIYNFIDKSSSVYNKTLKNLFTPDRIIKESKDNLFYVDLVTNRVIDFNQISNLSIDGVIVKEGHKILIKDQIEKVTIPTSTDPKSIFHGYYEIDNISGTNTTYRIPSSINGIYLYRNNKLIRDEYLNEYNNIIDYSICVRLGIENREKQFKLKKLNSGNFPQYQYGELYVGGPLGESIYFEESHNFILRQRMDYNNLYELSLNDTIKHATQSIIINKTIGTFSGTYSFIIPERTISIGEFGIIINHQENITNIINSKYKETLRSISETDKHYWVSGDNATLLKINKIDLDISSVNLSDNIITNLNSLSFYNNSIGVVVGDYNNIWITYNSGDNWDSIIVDEFDGFNYNKVIFESIDRFYIGGDNGVFIEFEYNLGQWTAHKRRISKYIDGIDDEYILVDDIKDMTAIYYLGKFIIAISCENGHIYLHDTSNLISSYDFLYIKDSLNNNILGDINSIEFINNDIVFSTFDKVYKTPIIGQLLNANSNILTTTFSTVFTQSSINSIFKYDNSIIYVGNFSLWGRYESSSTYSIYDNDYFNRLKPRLLFMDYDIGSKLYWFDDYGQYRIPERYGITISFLQGSGTNSYIGFNENSRVIYDGLIPINIKESNWITYFKDRQKTFQYYSNMDDNFVVHPSFTFSLSMDCGKTFSYSTQSITTDYIDIVDLMPNATPPMTLSTQTQSSRFREISGVPIILSTFSSNLYFYDYLGIWVEKFNINANLPEIGDVLNINSNDFNGNFIINRATQSSAILSPASSAHCKINIYFLLSSPSTYSFDIIVDGTTDILGGTLISGTHSGSLSTIMFMTAQDIYNTINTNTNITGFSSTSYQVHTPPFSTPYIEINIESPIGLSYSGLSVNITTSTLYGIGILLSNNTVFDNNGKDITYEIISYCYFYTDFNENILNNIKKSTSNINIRNLNKYPNNDSQYFIDNFNKHYISHAYNCSESILLGTQSFIITPKYSQFSAYYNLQSSIDIMDINGNNYSNDIKYTSGFLNFGYSPTFNLLNYLNYIDPLEYNLSKEFYSMPKWSGILGPDNILFSTQSSIWIDSGLETNKINLGSDIKYIWDSLFKWTFVDVSLNFTNLGTFETKKLLIINKYYNSNSGFYVLEFDKPLGSNYPGSFPGSLNNPFYDNIETIDINSRRKLSEISEDLQYINNIHRPKNTTSNTYDIDNTPGNIIGTYSNYEQNIGFKIPTDSYTKILLSDYSIIKNLSGVIYTDMNYNLSIQVTNLDEKVELVVSSITEDIISGNYQLDFNTPHTLNNGDYVIVEMLGTYSMYPMSIFGYHNISINGLYSIILPIKSTGLYGYSDIRVYFTRKDNFLNFEPIDIFDIGITDKKIKQSVEIKKNNWEITNSSYNIINLNLDKFRFKLVDGLDIEKLNDRFSWILEAEISNAVIGIDKFNNLVWYSGNWEFGRWFGGTWLSGNWMSGDWYGGTWKSNSNEKSIWYSGRWFDGIWEDGIWYSGRWYNGTHSNGTWYSGTWNDGTWNDGTFNSGVWVNGNWYNGTFNTDNGSSFWIDGRFYGGDFENGVWYNGVFDEKSQISRFGTKSFNSRNSIWKGGKFLSGQFHSYLNTDDQGNPIISDIHKYTKWYSGVFNGGDYYGGISYNINFKNTIWHGGISEDIDIIYVDTLLNTFKLSGEYSFNVNDEIYIVDKDFSLFSYYGTIDKPIKYKILTCKYNSYDNSTEVMVDINLYDMTHGYLIDGYWDVKQVNSNYTGTMVNYYSYLDQISSGDPFSEFVDSQIYIKDGLIKYYQNNILPYPPVISNIEFGGYNNNEIDLTKLYDTLNPNNSIYEISYSNLNRNSILTLKQDINNPSGIIVEILMERTPIYGTVSNLKCVSNFNKSTWNSGIWNNGVFIDGNYNGGIWYNGNFSGNWG